MKDQNPLVTIFSPNYNKSRFLRETIESILNQTYSNFEYIIIDDFSTDNSIQIINEYAETDERIKIFRNNKNLKIVKTRNKGFDLSSPKAKYFAILDSDDVALPNRIEIQVKFLEKNSDYGLVGSNLLIINENSETIGFRKYPSTDSEIRKSLMRFNPIAQSSVLLRKETIKEIGFYDKKWSVCQDYDYWFRIGISWKLANITKPLIKYRLSETQVKKVYLKETLQNTYKIQKRAINTYNYHDRIIDKIFRIVLRYSKLYSKLLYFIYKFSIKINLKFKYY